MVNVAHSLRKAFGLNHLVTILIKKILNFMLQHSTSICVMTRCTRMICTPTLGLKFFGRSDSQKGIFLINLASKSLSRSVDGDSTKWVKILSSLLGLWSLRDRGLKLPLVRIDTGCLNYFQQIWRCHLEISFLHVLSSLSFPFPIFSLFCNFHPSFAFSRSYTHAFCHLW